MTINERIKQIRKDKGLTQAEFGEKIGLKKTGASRIEQVGEPVNPRVIQLICNNFDINEEWLRYGTGEMYKQRSDSLMAEVADRYGLTVRMAELVRSMCGLDAVIQEQVCDFIQKTSKSMEEAKEKEERERQLQEIRESLPDGKTMTADEVAFMQKSLEAYRFEKKLPGVSTTTVGFVEKWHKKMTHPKE